MRFPRVSTVALIILLVTSMFGGVVIAASPAPDDHIRMSSSAGDTTQSPDEPPEFTPADPAQLIYISVDESGNATWTVETRFVLTNDSDEAAFESYADAVVTGERDGGYETATFEGYLEQATAATDREMAIRDAGYESPRIDRPEDETNETDLSAFTDTSPSPVGVIAYSFTWEGFATTDANRIYVGDAFQAPDGGTWFPELTDEQRLIIEIPENYAFETAPVATRDRTVVWDGPHSFSESERELVLLRGADLPGNGGGNNDDGTGTDPGESAFLESSTIALIGFLGFIALVGVGGGYLYYRESESSLPAWMPIATSSEATRRDAESEATEPDTDSPSASAHSSEPETSHGGPSVAATVEDDSDSADENGVDPDLLSDEERVLRMLRANGGRMKQASIVTETNWSNAKVSQLLSKMDEDGDIEKLRIGRENLITLPEIDPTELE